MRISDWSSDVCSSDLMFVSNCAPKAGRPNPSWLACPPTMPGAERHPAWFCFRKRGRRVQPCMSIMLNSPQGGLMRRFRFSRSAAMLLLALVAGLCAAWAARQYLQDRIQLIEARAKVPMAERIVAAHDQIGR